MSAVTPKTAAELDGMREAGRLAAEVLDMIAPCVEVGMTTGEIDRICHDHIVNVQKAIPAPLQLQRVPKVNLHLGQRGYLPRHSLRLEAVEKRRYHQHRRHRDKRWLAW